MPTNFPEVWLNRVRARLTTADVAPWLDGIAELDVQVLEMGSGSASESNVIHIPTSEFEPDVLINNTAYPLALQAYTDTDVTISLDKYNTKATSLSDDQVIGASYPRIDAATRAHTRAITSKKYAKAAHAIAATSTTANTPVILTTGDGVVAGSGKRKRLLYDDLIALKDGFDKMECPAEGRRLVLSTDHMNDLLLDRKNFGDQLVNYKTGMAAPVIAGFQIFSYVSNPNYTAMGVKIAFGAVAGATEFKASFAFYDGNIAKKTGMTKQYFQDAKTDPTNQLNLLNYRHYFIAVPMKVKYIGAIVSSITA